MSQPDAVALPPARDAARLLLRRAGGHAGRRRADFVRVRQAGVVAVQTAQGVVGAAEPVVREAAAEAELERVVLALRLAASANRRRSAGDDDG